MKNLKLSSIILTVLTIATFVYNGVEANAELWGIDAKILEIALSIITFAKFIYDQYTSYTEAQMVSFGEYMVSEKRSQKISEANKNNVTHPDLETWKKSQKI